MNETMKKFLEKKVIEQRLAKAKKNKYNYYKVLQVKYSNENGWEDECQYQTDSMGNTINRRELREDLKAYRENCTYPTRTILRKELKAA